MPVYGLLTNPSHELISEISKIYDLSFDYVEIGIEGPEGNPDIINQETYFSNNKEEFCIRRLFHIECLIIYQYQIQ
jgi:hypothetical protein